MGRVVSMENLNNMTMDERLEIHRTEILNIKKPQYQFGDKNQDKPKKKKFLLKRNVYLEWELSDSEAFRSLSGNAMRVLIRFLQKRTWTGKKKQKTYINTGLVFTYAEAEELGISTSSFHDIIKKIYEMGFIDIEHQGGGLAKDCSRYAVSDRWKLYGTPNFKPVTKKKVCRAGHDVHSRKQALKQVTGNRNYQLRKIVTVDGFENQQGIGKP
jgi:hypothetical protein